MNKQELITKVNTVNNELTKRNIPFTFKLSFWTGCHPSLMLVSNTGETQLRKGNYSQLWQSLLKNYQTLVDAFSHTSQVQIIANGEAYTTEYDNVVPLSLVVQNTANLLRKPVTVTVNNKYYFIVYPL